MAGRAGAGMLSVGGLLVAGWVVYIILGSTPQARIERSCKIVPWTQNFTVSILQLAGATNQVQGTTKMFGKVNYGCQYTIWRMFYESDYKKQQQQQNAAGATSAAG